MGAPSQVQGKLCVAAVTFALSLTIGGSIAPQAEETRASCIDPSAYARSVVSISWYFDRAKRDGNKQIVGERATAWFYTSPRLLVTAAHFASELPSQSWQDAELRQTIREGEPEVVVRVQLRVVIQGSASLGEESGAGLSVDLAEDVAILELREPFPNAQVLDVGADLPRKNAMVLVLGYPDGKVQTARGVVRETGDPAGRYAGLTLLEVQGSDRLLLKGGTSGAPVFDCLNGQVIGVLNSLLTSPALPFLSEHAVIPTPWGSPTNTAVPASMLTAIRNCIIL